MDWENFYLILEVDPEASPEEIKRSYRAKALAYHPDRLYGVADEEKRLAEDKLKAVNRANEVLSDPEKRRKYDREWRQRDSPPRPEIDPPVMRFDDVAPQEMVSGAFVLSNAGGPYSAIRINNPDSWVNVTGYESLTEDDELPLRVDVEVRGEDWGRGYFETIAVALDEHEAEVRVELRTAPAPKRRQAPQTSFVTAERPDGPSPSGRTVRAEPAETAPAAALMIATIDTASLGMKWTGIVGMVAAAAVAAAVVLTSLPLGASVFMAPLIAVLFGILGAAVGAVVGWVGGAIIGLVYGAMSKP